MAMTRACFCRDLCEDPPASRVRSGPARWVARLALSEAVCVELQAALLASVVRLVPAAWGVSPDLQVGRRAGAARVWARLSTFVCWPQRRSAEVEQVPHRELSARVFLSWRLCRAQVARLAGRLRLKE